MLNFLTIYVSRDTCFIHSNIAICKRISITEYLIMRINSLINQKHTLWWHFLCSVNSVRISVLTNKVDQACFLHIIVIDIKRLQGQSEEADLDFIVQNSEEIYYLLNSVDMLVLYYFMGWKQVPGYDVEFLINNPVKCNSLFWNVNIPLDQIKLTVNRPWINNHC
jgi:hypothetical protein